MKRSVQLAHIRQLCCLGYPGQSLMPALLRAVREFIGADSAGFFWVNARGDMTNLFAERMLSPGLMRLYFERHYDGAEHPFRQAFLRARKFAGNGVVVERVARIARDGLLQRYPATPGCPPRHVLGDSQSGARAGELSFTRGPESSASAFTAR